jgi:hypothetical protein
MRHSSTCDSSLTLAAAAGADLDIEDVVTLLSDLLHTCVVDKLCTETKRVSATTPCVCVAGVWLATGGHCDDSLRQKNLDSRRI